MHESLTWRLNDKQFRHDRNDIEHQIFPGTKLSALSPACVAARMKSLLNGKQIRGPAKVQIWSKGYKWDNTPVKLTNEQIMRKCGM